MQFDAELLLIAMAPHCRSFTWEPGWLAFAPPAGAPAFHAAR